MDTIWLAVSLMLNLYNITVIKADSDSRTSMT